MGTVAIILAVVSIIISVVLIILVVMQEGNSQGMGILGGGGADTFYGKEKGRSFEQKLKRFTTMLAIIFAIVTIVLYLILARGV